MKSTAVCLLIRCHIKEQKTEKGQKESNKILNSNKKHSTTRIDFTESLPSVTECFP